MALAIPNVFQREPGFVFSQSATPANFPEVGLEGVCAMLGKTQWGPTELTLVSSIDQFAQIYGGYLSASYPTYKNLSKLFDNSVYGGQAAPVLFKRVVNYGDITDPDTITAAKSSGALKDGALSPAVAGPAVADTGNTGDDTVAITGTFVGTTQGEYTIRVIDGQATYGASSVNVYFTPNGGVETLLTEYTPGGTVFPVPATETLIENGVSFTFTDVGTTGLTTDDEWTIPVIPEGTPTGDARINVSGKYYGDFGNDISVTVLAATSGTVGDFNLSVKVAGVEKELYEDLSLDTESANYFKKVVNPQSLYIELKDTANIQDVTLDQTIALTGGDDGSAVTLADYTGSVSTDSGLHGFTMTRYPTRLSCPDMEVSNDALAFMRATDTYIKGYNNRMWAAYVVPRNLATYTGIETWYNQDLQIDSRYGAIYFGWLEDENTGEWMSPTSAICGVSSKTARNRSQYGVWTNFAGVNFTLTGFRGVHKAFTSDVNGKLNELGINVIKNESGVGIYPNGCRTMSKTEKRDYKYIAQVLNTYDMEAQLEQALGFVKFKNLSASLYNDMYLAASGVLAARNAEGGFNTEDGSPFEVICDNSIQTPEMKNKGIVLLKWGIRNRFCAEFIWLHFTNMTSGASL